MARTKVYQRKGWLGLSQFDWPNPFASPLWRAAWEVLSSLRLRPDSGSLVLDLFLILAVSALQHVIIPDLFGGRGYYDFLTPWLALCLVLNFNYPRSVLLCFVAGLSMEMQSTSPMGLYVCGYWLSCNIIFLVRSNVSWTRLMPWIAIVVGCQSIVCFLEASAFFAKASFSALNASYMLSIPTRLLLSAGIAWSLVHRFKLSKAELE